MIIIIDVLIFIWLFQRKENELKDIIEETELEDQSHRPDKHGHRCHLETRLKTQQLTVVATSATSATYETSTPTRKGMLVLHTPSSADPAFFFPGPPQALIIPSLANLRLPTGPITHCIDSTNQPTRYSSYHKPLFFLLQHYGKSQRIKYVNVITLSRVSQLIRF